MTGGVIRASGTDEVIPVPSGQEVRLLDVIWNEPGPEGLTLRFRFLAPRISRDGGDIPYDTAATDMMHLCTTYVLPRLSDFGPTPAQIVITFADRPVPFGETAPDATQFFEAFSLQDGTCIWEIF